MMSVFATFISSERLETHLLNSTDWHQVVIFAGGNPLSPEDLDRFVRPEDKIVAADGGYRMCATAGRRADVLIGDMDSIDPKWLRKAEDEGTEILTFPREKDQTDLELALEYAACKRSARRIRVLGALGGRWDMSFGNLCLLLHPMLKGIDVRLVEPGTEIRLMSGPQSIILSGKAGNGLSLIPFGDTVEGLRLNGLRYELNHETLLPGSTRGISNVFVQDEVTIEWAAGKLMILHDGSSHEEIETSDGFAKSRLSRAFC